MKKIIFTLAIFVFTSVFLNTTSFAQEFCDDFGENSFTDTCAEQMGDGTSGPVVAPPIDIYDAATGGSGSDGTPDVQITIESTVCNSGCGMGGPYNIGGCVGGNGALGTSSDFAAAFNNGNGENTCINAGGYVCYTIDFINGFSTTAAGFDLGQSSNNGSSEGYEGSFGYVTAGTDANGAPLAGLPAINLANFCNYTSTDYATTSMSTFLGVTGPGTWQTDSQNTNPNNTGSMASDANGQNICGTTTSENGEDTASGTGPDQGTGAAAANPNLGLAPTDIITQVKYVYFYSSTPSIDCDMDGLTAANSNPSGSWTGIDFCFEALCTFPEPTVTFEENCGFFDIVIGTIDESMASGMGTSVTYTTAATAPMVMPGTAVTGMEQLAADGTTMYYIQIADAADPNCIEEFGPFMAPAGTPAPMLTVTCPPPIDICGATTTAPLGLTDSSGGAMAVYGGTCAAYVNTNGTATDVTDDFIDAAGAPVGSCMLTIQLVDANGCDSGTPETCNISFISTCDADGGEFPSGG